MAAILQAADIKLKNVATMSTAIGTKETTFVDVMRALVNYAGEISLQRKVSLMVAWIMDTVEDTTPSRLLLIPSCARLVRYVQFVNHLLKNVHKLPILERLNNEARTRMDLEILHLDSHVSCRSVDDDVRLMVGAPDFLMNNLTKTSPFNAGSFYKAVKLVLTDLRELHTRHL